MTISGMFFFQNTNFIQRQEISQNYKNNNNINFVSFEGIISLKIQAFCVYGLMMFETYLKCFWITPLRSRNRYG